MKHYEDPEMEVVLFDAEDIIRTSGGIGDDTGGGDEGGSDDRG